MSGAVGDSKICAHCGRRFEWRKKWVRAWDEVRYCSDACRRAASRDRAGSGSGTSGPELETQILALLGQRAAGLTICPSEVLTAEMKQDSSAMEAVRQAARRLVARGAIEILQKGHVVDPSEFRGPIRLRLVRGR